MWYDAYGNTVARIELASDFLSVREKFSIVRVYDTVQT